MSQIINLPVSLGEAIDKLSILQIKLEKINDSRKLDVEKEYNLLYNKLKNNIIKYNNLYNAMKKINLIIWDQMDQLRDGNLNDDQYSKLCRECIERNDVRFRIKNKINLITNSSLKEQKSYKINRVVIILNKSPINYLKQFIKIIEELSYLYDQIIINSDHNISQIKEHFIYDNTIIFNQEFTNLQVKETFIFDKNNYILDDILNLVKLDYQKLITNY